MIRVLLCVLFAALASAASAKEPKRQFRLPHWMGDLTEQIGDRPLSSIVIPASHDAGTYRIHDNKGWCGPAHVPEALQATPELLEQLQGDLWSTQSLSLVDQLDLGVRYFDFRLCRVDGEWWFYHGSKIITDTHSGPVSHRLSEELSGIAQWARAHPTEVVVLDLHKADGGDAASYGALYDELVAAFGTRLVDARQVKEVTGKDGKPEERPVLGPHSKVKRFAKAGKNVMIIDSSDVFNKAREGHFFGWNAAYDYGSMGESRQAVCDAPTHAAAVRVGLDEARNRDVERGRFMVTSLFPCGTNMKFWGSVLHGKNLGGVGQELVDAFSCPTGSHFDPRNGGECWRCPDGAARTVFPVHEGKACEQVVARDLQPATDRGKGSGFMDAQCPSGSVHDLLTGRCWTCPGGYGRTLNPGDHAEACVREASSVFTGAEQLDNPGRQPEYEPRDNFLQVGRDMNRELIALIKEKPAAMSRLNVIWVDNVGMVDQHGGEVDKQLMRLLIRLNLPPDK